MLVSHYRSDDWPDWLAGIGRRDLWRDDGMEFASSVLTYQGAAQGLGVAIGQVALLSDDFISGSLVPLFEPIERPAGHYLVWPKTKPIDTRHRAFMGWLKSELGL